MEENINEGLGYVAEHLQLAWSLRLQKRHLIFIILMPEILDLVYEKINHVLIEKLVSLALEGSFATKLVIENLIQKVLLVLKNVIV